MTRSTTDPPTDVSALIATAPQESSDRQHRAAIHYAHRLLWEQPPLTGALEARDGEEIVRVDDGGG